MSSGDLNFPIIFTESEGEASGTPRLSSRRISAGGRGSLAGQQVNLCEELLKELVKHPDSGPFSAPVSKKAVSWDVTLDIKEI